MMRGPGEIIRCPSCGMCQSRMTLRSGNTFGATFYSDGKRVAPMLPEFPHFVKCPKCSVFFKIDESVRYFPKNAGEFLIDADDFELPSFIRQLGDLRLKDLLPRGIPGVRFLTIDEYRQAISEGLYNGEKNDMQLLRISLWRAYNDRSRVEDNIYTNELFDVPDEERVYQENCRHIVSDFTKNDDDKDRLLCAELFRNLGEFNACTHMLSEVQDKKKYKNYISSIIAACEAKKYAHYLHKSNGYKCF